MTWLDKWQQGRTHIRHILFKFLPNLCYIKIIKVIKFGDKIFNRTKVINKNLKGEVKFYLPPKKIGLNCLYIACGVNYNAIFRSCPYNFCPWLYVDSIIKHVNAIYNQPRSQGFLHFWYREDFFATFRYQRQEALGTKLIYKKKHVFISSAFVYECNVYQVSYLFRGVPTNILICFPSNNIKF